MVKRALTEEEAKLEKEGIIRNEKELNSLKQNLRYNQDLIDKQLYLRIHDDRWRDFLREQKDKEDKQVIEAIEREIEIKRKMIELANKNIEEGVEIKEVSGVG